MISLIAITVTLLVVACKFLADPYQIVVICKEQSVRIWIFDNNPDTMSVYIRY